MTKDGPVAPYEHLVYHGDHIKMDTKGKTLVVPTGNPTLLPLFNEYASNANRLTVAESPFGGLKGAYPPDYAVGTVFCQTDGVYLTDISGTNTTKTLTAGKLKELNNLTVDTTNHVITEEFIIRNDNTGSDVTVIDACDTTTGWIIRAGTGTLSLDVVDFVEGNGSIKGVANGSDALSYLKFTTNLNLSTCSFITFNVKTTTGKTGKFYIDDGVNSAYTQNYTFTNTWTKYVIPIKKMTNIANVNLSTVKGFRFDIINAVANDAYQIDNITACNGTWAKCEVSVPDNAKSTGSSYFDIYTHNGTAYESSPAFKSSESNGVVYQAFTKMLDGTTTGDMYAASGQYYRGMVVTNLGERLSFVTKTASFQDPNFTTPVQISNNYGTLNRRIIAILIPPSGSTSGINKVRLKLKMYYDDVQGNTVPDLSGNNNNGTIVGGVTKLNEGGLKFDGSTGYVNCGNTTSFDVGNSAFSIVAKISTASNTPQMIVSKNDFQSPYHGFYFAIFNNTTLRCNGVDASGTTFNCDRTVSLCDNNIHTVAVTYSDTELKLYADGVQLGTALNVSGIGSLSDNTNFQIGARDGANTPFNGSMYEIFLFKRELSNTEAIAYTSGVYDTGDSVCHYKPTVQNMGSTTHEFSNDTNASTGLQHIVKPWIAILEDDTQEIDFYQFDERPKNLTFKRDQTGTVYELNLYPGNGNCRHGKIKYSNLTRDTDSDGIPDCLDPQVAGSVTTFLKSHDFAKDWYYETDISSSAITANDFSITASSLDIIPYALPEGDSVSDTNNVIRPVVETVATSTGNVSIFDVRGLDTIRVRDSPYTNAGECKVFDTVTAGNTNESTWMRVYSTDWVFTGDKVIDNGLIKLKSTTSQMHIYSNVLNTWVYVGYYSTQGGSTQNWIIASIASITIDKCEFVLSGVVFGSAMCTIQKGKLTFSVTYTDNTSLSHMFIRRDVDIRFFNYSGEVSDTAITTGFLYPSVPHVAGIILNAQTIPLVVTTKASNCAIYLGDSVSALSYEFGTRTPYNINIGAIPFDCTLLYTDSANLTGGDTI